MRTVSRIFFAGQDSGHLRFYRFGKSRPWRRGTVAIGAARFCLSGNGVLLIAKAKPALRIEEGGRQAPLSAQIFAGSEPHRAGLLQTQARAQKSQGTLLRCRPSGHWQTPRLIQPSRMRQLSHKLRIWCRPKSTRSSFHAMAVRNAPISSTRRRGRSLIAPVQRRRRRSLDLEIAIR
jgi:hypothetical protein